MRRLASIVSVLSVLAYVAAAPGARAQAPATAPQPNAAAVAERAKRDHDLGRLPESIEGFARAYQLSGDSALLFSLGEVHREAGHHGDALRTFQNYLRRDPKGAHRDSAEKHIKELERLIRKGGADGKPAASPSVNPKAPTPVVPVAASAPPSSPQPPTSRPPVVTAPPPRAAIAPPTAIVAAPPPVAVAPASPPPVAPAPTVASTSTSPGVDLNVTAPAEAPADDVPLPRWIPWTLAATTVALGVGAAATGMSASNRYDELSASCGETSEGCATHQIDDLKSHARTANILWALTAVAAVGTGVTVYLNANAAGVAGLWRF